MKRSTLLLHLRRHGCVLKREGAAHSLWSNPSTGATEAVPRHTEISVDTKKKELIGNYANAGQQWLPAKQPKQVRGHDFPTPDVPRLPLRHLRYRAQRRVCQCH